MEIANKLELHYYFNDDSHSMDAYIRNKCEAEVLALIHDVAITLGIDISLDSEALKEGGLRNIWKFLGENGVQIGLILSVISILLAIKQLYPSPDELDQELKKLSIEEKRLNIEKLKRELNSGEVNPETIQSAANAINSDFKVLTRKSNFYKNLDNYEKITGVGFNTLTSQNEPTKSEIYVPKTDFYHFILNSNQLPDEVIDDAEIEIVSPVIKEGKYKWRGIYRDEPISFYMNDSDFKIDVLAKRVSFQHGAIIRCVLKIEKELDETGEVVTKGYAVTTVISKIDGDVVNETSQGKRYKFTKQQRDNQKQLFSEG